MERLVPPGKAAWATRAGASGTSSTPCGGRDLGRRRQYSAGGSPPTAASRLPALATFDRGRVGTTPLRRGSPAVCPWTCGTSLRMNIVLLSPLLANARRSVDRSAVSLPAVCPGSVEAPRSVAPQHGQHAAAELHSAPTPLASAHPACLAVRAARRVSMLLWTGYAHERCGRLSLAVRPCWHAAQSDPHRSPAHPGAARPDGLGACGRLHAGGHAAYRLLFSASLYRAGRSVGCLGRQRLP